MKEMINLLKKWEDESEGLPDIELNRLAVLLKIEALAAETALRIRLKDKATERILEDDSSICSVCYQELSSGDIVYIDKDEDIICFDCMLK